MKLEKFKVENILVSHADAIFLDLEDAVPLEMKQSQRTVIAEKLTDPILTNLVSRFWFNSRIGSIKFMTNYVIWHKGEKGKLK